MVKRTWLLLGGSGLICGELAARLDALGDDVFCIDRREPKRKEIRRFYLGDALDKKLLERVLAEVQPDGIINGINLATIFSREPAVGFIHLIRYICDTYYSLRTYLSNHERGDKEPLHFVQLGTTGSGGLGLNIPFTHGESIAQLPIINKAAFSGIITSLLVLLSRSFEAGAIRISEVKPGLAIFSDIITRETSPDAWSCVTLDGGESGAYTYQELALLTRWMGFTTVNRIVDRVMNVINGETLKLTINANDITAALNSIIVAPDSNDQKKKKIIMEEMRKIDTAAANGRLVIASGNLGPAEITADLILSHALIYRKTWTEALQSDPAIGATLSYLSNTSHDLGTRILDLCSEDRQQRLIALSNGTERDAWEIVAKKLESSNKLNQQSHHIKADYADLRARLMSDAVAARHVDSTVQEHRTWLS